MSKRVAAGYLGYVVPGLEIYVDNPAHPNRPRPVVNFNSGVCVFAVPSFHKPGKTELIEVSSGEQEVVWESSRLVCPKES